MRIFPQLLLIYLTTSICSAESFRTSDGEILNYASHGEGEKIVFLSGGPGFNAHSLKHWADSLANNYTCILFDQRGTGFSSNVKMDCTTINLKTAIQDVDDLRKHLGEETITICGFSWGGMLAQAYAGTYSEHLKKMILVSTLGPDLSLSNIFFQDNLPMRQYPAEKDSLQFWNQQSTNPLSAFKQLYFSTLPYFYDHEIGAQKLPGFLATISFNSTMANLMWQDLTINYDLKPKLTSYHKACYIIRARQDPIPAEAVFQVKESLPQTEILYIERCGHFPGLEQPNTFFSILKEIL